MLLQCKDRLVDMVVLEELEQARTFFLQYTRKAFLMLPKMEKPKILDVGCGSGLPTIEMAKLSNGEVTGIDIDQTCIVRFRKRIINDGLSGRVTAIEGTLDDVKFPNESFDVVWSEGVIGELTFKKELEDWRRLIKPDGFLVIHYQILEAQDTIAQLQNMGYVLTETVLVPEKAWWTEFYKPLEEKMGILLDKYKYNLEALKLLKTLQNEIEVVKKEPNRFNTAFYIMRKT